METKEKLNISDKCSQVTIDEFIDCLINENYSRLLQTDFRFANCKKSENYRLLKEIEYITEAEISELEKELQAAWERLYSEYCQLSGSKQHSYMFDLHKSIAAIQIKILLATKLIEAGNADILQQLGYGADIKKATAKIKFDTVALQGKQKEFERIKGNGQHNAITEGDFDDWIIAVDKYLGYAIRRKEMILSEFLAANKAMQKELSAERNRKRFKK
ncbi:MAG: hypothetical protein LBP63_10805 [Prevotellaceae bacterium]|jgi:hypothetical protein|nr:hypothetical protein [Prevotellaceae bacterium]